MAVEIPLGISPSQVAQLKTINFKALQNNSSEELRKLISAAKQDGVFYLDLTGNGEEAQVYDSVDDLYRLSQSIFDMSDEEKLQFDVDKLGHFKLNGYKPIGRNLGGIKGQRDGFESYAIPRNGISSLASAPFPRPAVVDEHMQGLKCISTTCTTIAQVIFRMLSAALLLPEDKSFESFHRASHGSPDIVRLLKYAANTADNAFAAPQAAHTDIGSLTFLFSDSPGLQILPAGSTEWLYVLPKARQPIVNFGDAMSIFTNGLIRNVYHRVASLPGKGMEERYSFAFLMRPDPSAPMCPLPSPAIKSEESSESVLTSEERIAAKFGLLRGSLKS